MREDEIRPKAVLDSYLELSAMDGRALQSQLFVEVPCPACQTFSKHTQITKNSFDYKKCPQCQSLYCSPRPNKEQLDSLYFDSESSKFWSNVFFPTVAEARREKLIRPKAEKIAQILREKRISVSNICDVGAGHGIFLDELAKHLKQVEMFAIEPDEYSAGVCEKKGIKTLRETAENASSWANKFDFVLSFEVIEHVFDLKLFVESLFRIIKPGGYCLLTGLGYEGFDILSLQGKSKAVSPPHHLNFLSVAGFEKLFTSASFTNVDVWTPGELDVDIVFNSETDNEFIRAMKSRGPEAAHEFQLFLRKYKLSSHTWIMAQKPESASR